MYKFFESNPVAFIFSILVLISFGFYNFINLPISLYPSVEKPTVRVRMFFTNDVTEFVQLWGGKIEKSLHDVKDVELVEGEYQQGKVTYKVRFVWGKDSDDALRDVSNVITSYQSRLERNLPPARVDYYNPGVETYSVVYSDNLTSLELRQELELKLLPQLSEINGVHEAWVSEYGEDVVSIEIDPIKVVERRVDVVTVIEKIKDHEFDGKIGNIVIPKYGSVSVTYLNGVGSIGDIENIVVARDKDYIVALGDVAEVKIKTAKVSRLLQMNGVNATAVAVWPRPGANLYSVAAEFKLKTSKFITGIGHISMLNDPAEFISQAINKVAVGIGFGMLVSAIIVLMFYRSVGKTTLVCLAMPFSVMGSGLVMNALGISINLLSLGAISISFGMVVDSVIIVIDHISNENAHKKTVFENVREISPAVFASIITTIIVFLPLAVTQPIVSALLKDISYVVVSIMLFSALISLVLIPSIISVFRAQKIFTKEKPLRGNKNIGFETIISFYCYTLRCLIENKVLKISFIIVSLGMILVSFSLVDGIKKELIAKPKAEIIDVILNYKKEGTDIENRLSIIEPLRQKIADRYGDKLSFIYSDIRTDFCYLTIHLKSYTYFDEIYQDLNKFVRETNEYTVEVNPWITSALAVPDYPDIRLYTSGVTENQRRERLMDVSSALERNSAITKVRTTPQSHRVNQFNINFDRGRLAKLKMSDDVSAFVSGLANYIGLSVESKFLYKTDINEIETDLQLQVGNKLLRAAESIESVPFRINDEIYHLRDVSNVESVSKPKFYYRRNTKPAYMVEAWLKPNAKAADVIDDLQKQFSNNKTVPFVLSDPQAETKAGIYSLVLALLIGIVLVYAVLLFIFSQFTISSIICLAIPFGVAGAILSLYIFDSPLSMNSVLGMIMLSGISVNNAIILCDIYLREKRLGGNKIEIIISSARKRFCTIVVTTMTTVAGFIPLAIGLGSGGKIQQPLGISVSAGIILSMLFTMYIIPIFLDYFERGNEDSSLLVKK